MSKEEKANVLYGIADGLVAEERFVKELKFERICAKKSYDFYVKNGGDYEKMLYYKIKARVLNDLLNKYYSSKK